MGQTPIYSLPYPEYGDPAEIPLDMHELATAVEAAIGAGGGGSADLVYNGSYVSGPTYDDGDIVVGADGIPYMCVVDGTTTAPTPWPGMGTSFVYSGTYLGRPAASAVPVGTIYAATDTLGQWRSDGTAWTLVAQGTPTITPAQMSAAPFTTPYDRQRIALLVDDPNGVVWTFQYRAASASAYKWEFLGGAPLIADDPSSVSGVTSTTYTVIGAGVNVPRAGDYDWHLEAWVGTQTNGMVAYYAAKIGAAAASDNDSAQVYFSTVFGTVSVSRSRRALGLAAGAGILPVARVNTSQASFGNRTLTVTPVRVS